MRLPLLITLTALACLQACTSGPSPAPVVKGDSTVLYPFAAIYTESYGKGKTAQAKAVLQFWKVWEHGDVRKLQEEFADTVFLALPEEVYSGTKKGALELLHQRRQQYADVQLFVDSWLPARAEDPGDDLVFLWGRQDGTKPNGQRDYRVIHEIWKFDRRGRIESIIQYLTHPF